MSLARNYSIFIISGRFSCKNRIRIAYSSKNSNSLAREIKSNIYRTNYLLKNTRLTFVLIELKNKIHCVELFLL